VPSFTTESFGPDATGVLSTVTGVVTGVEVPVDALDVCKTDGNVTAAVPVINATTTTTATRPRRTNSLNHPIENAPFDTPDRDGRGLYQHRTDGQNWMSIDQTVNS
jgi:hypothetical protein